ncbi:MAG: helix-turn-helix transcriptional regulator [Gammaproteobacteria bacterium]
MQRLLSYNDLKTLGIPYSKSHLYYLMNHAKFPRPIKLTANTVAWAREDIEEWINKKIELSKKAPLPGNHI